MITVKYREFGSNELIEYVNAVTDYKTINFTDDHSLISIADVTDNFIGAVMKQSRYKDSAAKKSIHIIYTASWHREYTCDEGIITGRFNTSGSCR